MFSVVSTERFLFLSLDPNLMLYETEHFDRAKWGLNTEIWGISV